VQNSSTNMTVKGIKAQKMTVKKSNDETSWRHVVINRRHRQGSGQTGRSKEESSEGFGINSIVRKVLIADSDWIRHLRWARKKLHSCRRVIKVHKGLTGKGYLHLIRVVRI
jgi:hypothetical protein